MNLFARYAERIDATTLRERILIFIATAMVLLVVFYAAAINPLLTHRTALSKENQRLNKELDTMQHELQQLFRARAASQGESLRQHVAGLQRQLSELEARVVAQHRRFTPPDRMRVVLEGVLERNPHLKLIDLKTLPVAALGDAGKKKPGHRVFRHGIQLTVSGSYVDLYHYLNALEHLPTQLYWGRVRMEVTHYPTVTLKLTVYTISFDKAWLVV